MDKDNLKDYQGLLLEEKQLEEKLKMLESEAYSANSTNLDGMPKGNDISDPTARYAVKLQEIKEKLENKHIEVLTKLSEIETAIDGLRPLYRYIMREYYIYNKKWEQIAVDTHYSIQRIWQIHGEALRNIRAN